MGSGKMQVNFAPGKATLELVTSKKMSLPVTGADKVRISRNNWEVFMNFSLKEISEDRINRNVAIFLLIGRK